MTNHIQRLLAAIGLAFVLASAALAQPAAPSADEVLKNFAQQADQVTAAIEENDLTTPRIDRLRADLEEQRKSLTRLAEEAGVELAPLLTRMEALGPAPEDAAEPEEIAAQRATLKEQIDATDARKKRAEEAAARASALLVRLTEIQRQRFTEELLQRGPSPLSPDRVALAAASLERQASAVRLEVNRRIALGGAMESMVDRLALPAILAFIGLFIAFAARRWLVQRLQGFITEDASHSRMLGVATGLTLARLILPAVAVALIIAAAMESGLAGPTGKALLQALGQGALIVIGAYALGGAYFAPETPAVRLSSLDNVSARRAHRWLILIAVIIAADRVLIQAGRDIGLTTDALSVLNGGLLVLGGLILWRFVIVSRLGLADTGGEAQETDEPAEDAAAEDGETSSFNVVGKIARTAARLVAIVAPLLALAGYFAASRFVFYPLVFSGAVIGTCLLVQTVAREISVPGGRARAERSGAAGERVPFLPVITGFVLVLIAGPVLALIWGASVTDLGSAWDRTIEGFTIGDVTLAPVDFILFAIVFSIGYLLTRAVKGVLRRSVLPLMKMDEGAKSALLAGVGYVGIIISALVAISTTGLDLSNLAIVAGALSVGIGFGLQNIVNNFVSGIILLIERPIKTGDWVEIAGVHGTVRKVNVRSTEIQTFDRSTMFVPNADLISGTVTNWTHADSLGRLIVPVGVAYGTDARRVEKVLLEIVQAHPMLMRRPAPYVVFAGFGADSIDFEIRGVLRDVNWILNVGSDIRYSVYERFAEEGIEIPFAQRDLHIKNIGELRAAVSDRAPTLGASAPNTTPPPPGEGPDQD